MLEYGLVLILVAMLLIILLGIVGKAPRQTLADVYCVVKYKASDPMHAVDLTQPADSGINTAAGSHTPGASLTWTDFKTQYGWQTDSRFVCVDGLLGGGEVLSSYTVLDGN